MNHTKGWEDYEATWHENGREFGLSLVFDAEESNRFVVTVMRVTSPFPDVETAETVVVKRLTVASCLEGMRTSTLRFWSCPGLQELETRLQNHLKELKGR